MTVHFRIFPFTETTALKKRTNLFQKKCESGITSDNAPGAFNDQGDNVDD